MTTESGQARRLLWLLEDDALLAADLPYANRSGYRVSAWRGVDPAIAGLAPLPPEGLSEPRPPSSTTHWPPSLARLIADHVGVVAVAPDAFLIEFLLRSTPALVMIRQLAHPSAPDVEGVLYAVGGPRLVEVAHAHPRRIVIAHAFGSIGEGRVGMSVRLPVRFERGADSGLRDDDGIRAFVALGHPTRPSRDAAVCALLGIDRDTAPGSIPWRERVGDVLVSWSGSAHHVDGATLRSAVEGRPVLHWTEGPLGPILRGAFACREVSDLEEALARARRRGASRIARLVRASRTRSPEPETVRRAWKAFAVQASRVEWVRVSRAGTGSTRRVIVVPGGDEPERRKTAEALARHLDAAARGVHGGVEVILGIDPGSAHEAATQSTTDGLRTRAIAFVPLGEDAAGVFTPSVYPTAFPTDAANDLLDADAVVIVGEPGAARLPPGPPYVITVDGFDHRWSGDASERERLAHVTLPNLRQARGVICFDPRTAWDVRLLAGLPEEMVIVAPPPDPRSEGVTEATPDGAWAQVLHATLTLATRNARRSGNGDG